MKYFIFMCALLYALPALSQQTQQIQSDRPGETQTPSIVPHKKFQMEFAIQKEKHESEYRVFYPTVLFKYGLLKKLELRAEITEEKRKFTDLKQTITGLDPVELGLKASLIEGKGALPDISLLAQFALPGISSEEFKTPNVLPELRLLFENKLNDHIDLGYNLGAEWHEPEEPITWLYTLSPRFELTDHWSVYLEVFGEIKKNEKPQHSVDGSVAWLINDNLQIDINGGTGISSEAPKYFVSMGLSFRL